MANKFPPQALYIVGTEACERFSYYGMRSILVVFMTTVLAMGEPEAKGVYHFFVGSSYLLTVLGAFLADRLWGKYNTILWLSVIYVLGHAAMAMGETRTNLYIGLSLIALGAGGVKACVSAMVGDQFTSGDKKQLAKVFELFYFGINVGAFFSMLMIPFILPRYGARVAFAIPGVLMAIALLLFWAGRKLYVKIPPVRESKGGFLAVLFHSLGSLGARRPGTHLFDSATSRYGADAVEGAKSVLAVCGMFVWVIGFWALYDQSGGGWVLQAAKLDLNFLGVKWEASQVQAANGVFVLALIPLFSFGLYPLVEKLGIQVTPLRKMGTGMVLTALSFVIVGFIDVALESGRPVNVGWQLLAYVVLSAAEVMVSITGLEFAYTQAPRAMKSTIMSIFFLTVALGNYLAAAISVLNRWQGSREFFFYTALMLVVAVGFIVSSTRYRYRSYVETSPK